MGEDFQITFAYLLSIRKPLIAAINGPCAGLWSEPSLFGS